MSSSLPVCGLRESVAFLRDPAAFTAGRGLELGSTYRVRLPGRRLVVTTDPEWAEAVLVRRADAFGKSRIYWRTLRRMIGDSLGSLDDDRWAYLHGVERPFFTPRAVEDFMDAVAEHTAEHLDRVARRAGGGAALDVLGWLSELNARLLLAVLFGRDEEPRAEDIARRIIDGHEIVAWVGKYPWRPALARLTGASRRAAEHRRFFDAYTRGLREGAAGNGGNLLTALLGVETDPDAPRFTPSLLRNEIMFHLGAGIETQAAAEAWALYLLWKHPEALEEVRREGEPAARRTVHETLRLYPPVYGILRDCVRALEVGPHRLRAGDSVLVGVYGMHRSPALWDDPGAFRPERFAPSSPTPEKYRYLPFGAGRHVCIGRHLALPAMTLFLTDFARRFDWTFDDPAVHPDPRPSLKPAAPFHVRLAPRTPAGSGAGRR